MGGRDHSCDICGRGGFNDSGECECPPQEARADELSYEESEDAYDEALGLREPATPPLTPQETTRVDEKWLREHDAYYDCLDGGYRGYQGACWDCDWRGPERLRGDEEIGTEESRQHKRNAKLDAKHHRETAPWTAKDDTETLLARAKAAEQALERLREGPDHQYEHHVEQCAHGGTLMRLDQAEQALELIDELADALLRAPLAYVGEQLNGDSMAGRRVLRNAAQFYLESRKPTTPEETQ